MSANGDNGIDICEEPDCNNEATAKCCNCSKKLCQDCLFGDRCYYCYTTIILTD